MIKYFSISAQELFESVQLLMEITAYVTLLGGLLSQ